VGEGSDAEVTLSPEGVREAEALGRWLAGLAPEERPGLVAVSPYIRARQTWDAMAAVARAAGCPTPEALVDERIRDREMGVLELLPPPAVLARVPEEAARRQRLGEWFYRPPGGESLADVTLRVRDFLEELGAGAAGEHALVVAHDGVVVAVRRALAGIGGVNEGGGGAPVPDVAAVPNASVSRWDAVEEYGTSVGRLRLVRFGDVAHLGGTDTEAS
jgi:2,3-bisphosphoglycerate-dependent phosphoglycerate mutase